MRWFTSDLHLFHQLVYKKYRSKFATMDDMHQDIIIKWNKQVRTKDIVYVLGDVTFGKYEETKELLGKLHGRLILIRGNHDERFTSAQWIKMGFEDVRDLFVLKNEGIKMILNHFPYSSSFKFFFLRWKNRLKKRNEANYYKLFLSYKGYKLVHGHNHDGPKTKFAQTNVAWDVNGRLLSEHELLQNYVTDFELPLYRRIWETLKLIFY